MNRIYGKPEQSLVASVPPNPAADVIRSLSLAEKLELLNRLQSGARAVPEVRNAHQAIVSRRRFNEAQAALASRARAA
jgi:hypothetical protein